jgi:hypothetical protein
MQSFFEHARIFNRKGGELVSKREHPRAATAGIHVEEEMSRGDLLLKGTLAVGALYGLSAVGPYVRKAMAAEESGDVEVLNYLLPFEYVQLGLYERIDSEINSHDEKLPLGRPEKALIAQLIDEEEQHVQAVQEMIEDKGGEPVAKGKYAYAFRIYRQGLNLSGTIENASVYALNGSIKMFDSAECRELAYSICQTDARHAATALAINGAEPAPVAFDLCVPEDNTVLRLLPFTSKYPDFDTEPGE